MFGCDVALVPVPAPLPSDVSMDAGSSIAMVFTLKPESVSVPNGFTLSLASSAGVPTGGGAGRVATDVAQEQVGGLNGPADFGREGELDHDVVRLAVLVVVDVERVSDVRVEQEVVGSGAGLLPGEDVHDQDDFVGVSGL